MPARAGRGHSWAPEKCSRCDGPCCLERGGEACGVDEWVWKVRKRHPGARSGCTSVLDAGRHAEQDCRRRLVATRYGGMYGLRCCRRRCASLRCGCSGEGQDGVRAEDCCRLPRPSVQQQFSHWLGAPFPLPRDGHVTCKAVCRRRGPYMYCSLRVDEGRLPPQQDLTGHIIHMNRPIARRTPGIQTAAYAKVTSAIKRSQTASSSSPLLLPSAAAVSPRPSSSLPAFL